MIKIKDIKSSNYSGNGYSLEIHSNGGKDEYVIEEYGSIKGNFCLYRVIKMVN